MTKQSPTRDVRLDLLRGVALLVVFINHIPGNRISALTPSRCGLSDMAEVFVFLSGSVCGLSYGRVLQTDGFWACQKKACGRALQLYLANVIMVGGVMVTLHALAIAPPGYMSAHVQSTAALKADLLAAVPGIMQLSIQTNHFAILPLYLVLLVGLPSVLAGLRARPYLVLGVLLTAYLGTQWYPTHVALPEPWRSAWFFNPIAWQLLFFGGAALAFLRWEPRLPADGGCGGLMVLGLLLEAAFVWCVLEPQQAAHWSTKASLAPLRLVHFTVLMLLGRRLVPRDAPWVATRWLQPLLWCGQQSLGTYCLGGLLAITATIMLLTMPSTWMLHGSVSAAGCVGLCLAAKGMQWGKARWVTDRSQTPLSGRR